MTIQDRIEDALEICEGNAFEPGIGDVEQTLVAARGRLDEQDAIISKLKLGVIDILRDYVPYEDVRKARMKELGI